MPIRNFGRNLEFSPRQVLTPASEAEVLEILRQHKGRRIRAIGRLHCWSQAIMAEEVLLDLRRLSEVRLERVGGNDWAVVGAGCQINRVLTELERLGGGTLPTLGLISEQTIAGATATGTHGSGRRSLSHYLGEVRVAAYDAEGEPKILTFDGYDELRAARCSLGCLGIVLSVSFRCRPQYRIEEHFREYDKLEDVLAAETEYPLTQFYLVPWRWKWMAQHRCESEKPRSWLAPLYRLYWFLWIDVTLHLVILLLVRWLKIPALVKLFYRWIVPLAIVRPWRVVDKSQDMLVMEHELFRHLELEVFVRRSWLADAMEFVRETLRHCSGEQVSLPLPLGAGRGEAMEQVQGPHPNPLPKGEGTDAQPPAGCYVHHYAICIRKVQADDTLISMASPQLPLPLGEGRGEGLNSSREVEIPHPHALPKGEGTDEPHYAISLITYARPSGREGFFQAANYLAHRMAALFDARPHWGKYCPLGAGEIQRLYPQLPRFVEICQQYDPGGVFRNDWLDEVLFGSGQRPKSS